MQGNIITVIQDEPRVGTWILSNGFEVEHRALRKLVTKYKPEFNELGVIASAVQKPSSKGGRPIDEFLLNEKQAMYIGSLLTNSLKVRMFKLKLVKEFDRIKTELIRIMSQRQNAQWLETRNAGKVKRREETDTIKRFVEYAVTQGSKNAERYYSNISTMQNKSLFFYEQKFKNLRDILNLQQLSVVICADGIVSKAIEDGMDQKLHYKEIYQLAKKRIESFAEIHGKTLIPAFEQKQISADKMVD